LLHFSVCTEFVSKPDALWLEHHWSKLKGASKIGPSLTKNKGLKEKRKAAREAKTRPHALKPPVLKEKERFVIFCEGIFGPFEVTEYGPALAGLLLEHRGSTQKTRNFGSFLNKKERA
jgi:hypothetical protein